MLFHHEKNVWLRSRTVFLWEEMKNNLPNNFHPDIIRWSWKQERSSIFSKLSFKTRNFSFSRPKMMKFDTKVVTDRFLMIICHITPKRNTRNHFFPWKMDTENSHLNLSDKNKQLSLSFLVHKPPNTTTSPNGFSMESEGCPVDFLSRWSL